MAGGEFDEYELYTAYRGFAPESRPARLAELMCDSGGGDCEQLGNAENGGKTNKKKKKKKKKKNKNETGKDKEKKKKKHKENKTNKVKGDL